MKLSALAAMAACGMALAGCATIIKGSSQSIAITTPPVSGAQCTLSSPQGSWLVNTPGVVTVRKSKEDILARCTKPGWMDGFASIPSDFQGWTLGNAIAGGVIGLGVDAASGAMNEYPNAFQIPMMPGKSSVAAEATPPPATAAVSAQTAPGSARILESGGATLVPVTINNTIRLGFVVDSATSDVSIPEDVVLTLRSTGTIVDGDFLGNRTYRLADGSWLPSSSFRIRSLKVGDYTVSNVTAQVSPARGSLLLGQSFLGRFKSWTVDNRSQTLVLTGPVSANSGGADTQK